MYLATNQIKYGQIKEANFTIDHRNQGYKNNEHNEHNEQKCVVTERLTRTLKNKIYKYMTSVSKNVYL